MSMMSWRFPACVKNSTWPVAAIRAAWWSNSIGVGLRSGDLVIVDNMLAGHGYLLLCPSMPCYSIERNSCLSTLTC